MTTGRRLFGVMRPYSGLFVLGMGAEFFASLIDGVTVVLLVPLLTTLFGSAGGLGAHSSRLEAIVDRVLAPLVGGLPPAAAAGRIALLVVACLLLKNLLAVLARIASANVEEGVVRDLRRAIFTHLLRLDFGFLHRLKAGEVVSTLMADTEAAKAAVALALSQLFRNAVLIATTVAILAAISARLTLVTLAAAPLLVLVVRGLLRRVRRYGRAWADERAAVTATVVERVGAVKLIRAYGREAGERAAFEAQTERYRRRVVKALWTSAVPTPLSEVFAGLVVILLIWAATQPAVAGTALDPEATIVFLVAAMKLISPVKAVSQVPATMAIALGSADRVFRLLDLPLVETDAPDAVPARFEREIVLDRVTFGYDPAEPVLRDVSFTVAKGQVVAIVGPSGAGKTTLLELLPRFHDPNRGEVRLDGVPLPRLTRASVRRLLGVVSQDTVLLNDTVHANIAYGHPEATRAQVEAAAAAANAGDFIAQLPQRYDTVLGERGARLSGGQRQRIAIARALLRDPPILLLDEATSALDTESERLVQDAIDRLMRDRTVLVIAHRLATVLDADEILVLDEGRMVERGTHQALLAQNGLYRRLYDLQFRGAEVLA